MRKHDDFSKAIKNPYARLLKKQVTLRLDQSYGGNLCRLVRSREAPIVARVGR